MPRNEIYLETRPEGVGGLLGKEFQFSSERVKQAYLLGQEVHRGQFRHSGESYFEAHCVPVAVLLQNLLGEADEDVIVAALLHDTVEDQPDRITIGDIENLFGARVANMVDGVSKMSTPEGGWKNRSEKDQSALKKMAGKAYEDVGVILIKLSDRSSNIKTLKHSPADSHRRKADETIRAYGKLAGILNCFEWRRWMEDEAFPYADPENFEWIKRKIDFDPRLNPEFVNFVIGRLEELMEKAKISGKVEIVLNGYYESWKKLENNLLLRKGSTRSIEGINDVISFRMVVDGGNTEENIDQCYRLLGKMQREFGEYLLQDRFDDFIAVPQSGFAALQSTIYLSGMGEVEIAIETREMHERNNWGVIYDLKSGKSKDDYKIVTVLTPSNGLRFVSDGSTVLDAVASIQGNLLSEISDVLVNGKKIRLSDKVRPGDVIEVKTGEGRMTPSETWESMANNATKRILRSVLRREQIKDHVIEGKRLMEKLLRPRGFVDLEDLVVLKGREMLPLFESLGCADLEDLYLALGGKMIKEADLKTQLDKMGLNKKNLGWRTFCFSGSKEANVKGVLSLVGDEIAELGGNILRVVQDTDKEMGFELRCVVDGVVDLEEEVVRKRFEELGLKLEVGVF